MKIRHLTTLLSVVCLLVWALPVAALGQETEEVVEMTTPPTTVPATASGTVAITASDEGASSLLADCQGCFAAYGLWDGVWHIRALRESRTDEFVSRIHVHGAVIKALNDTCTGDWRFGEQVDTFSLTDFNTDDWQTHDETYWQGSQNSWGNVGAHEWEDEGTFWSAGEDGETDLCRTF